MKKVKILIIGFVALFMVVLLNMQGTYLSLSNTSLNNYNTINTVNPFEVHSSAGPNETWYIYLTKGTYFLDIAASAPFQNFFNVTLSGNGLNALFFTNNYEFHGVIINQSGVYTLHSIGSGKWIFSLFAQDPNEIYSFQLSSSRSFVIVPVISGISEIKINFENNQPVNVTIFDELLRSIYSAISVQNRSLYLNLSGNYEGILFLFVSPEINNTVLNLSWVPVQNNHFQPTNNANLWNPYYVGIFIIIIGIGLIILLFREKKRRRK